MPYYVETELARLLIVLGMLAVNSYTDIRYRTILGGDRHYAVVGAAGLILSLADIRQSPDAVFSMVLGVTLSLLLYRSKAVASGDLVILIAVSVSLPSVMGVQLLPVLVTLGGITMLAFSVVAYNLGLNLSRAFCGGGMLFSKYSKAGPHKKVAALFMAHHRRPWETHVVPIEEGDDFSLHVTPFDKIKNWEKEGGKAGQLVVVAAPVVPFLLAALVFILTVRIVLL